MVMMLLLLFSFMVYLAWGMIFCHRAIGTEGAINWDLKWFNEIGLLGLGETFGYRTNKPYLVILRRCRRISNSEEITREQPAIIFVQQCFLGTKKINSGFVQPPLLLV